MATLDELKRERDSVSNRISGVKTQIKRLGNDPSKADRRAYLEERLATLTQRRTDISDAISKLRREEQRARDRGGPLELATRAV